MAREISNFPAWASDHNSEIEVEIYTVFRILLQDYVICRKREDQALIDLDIHHSKAPNSDCLVPQHFKTFINSKFEVIKQLQITKSLKTYFI